MSLVGAAAIGAGATLLGTAGSAVSQGKLNRATRKWNEKMWALQNKYNTPEAQMERFKQAGLNPNLIYGQGTSGNADAPKQWSPTAPDLSGIGGAVGKYFQTKLQQGQLERIRTENAILATDLEDRTLDLDVKKKLSNVIVPNTQTDDHYSSDDPMHYVQAPKNMLYEGAAAEIQSKLNRADIGRVQATVAKKTQAAQISKTGQEVLNMAAQHGLIKESQAKSISQRELMELDKQLKQFEIDFQNNFENIRSSDLLRMLMHAIPLLLRK